MNRFAACTLALLVTLAGCRHAAEDPKAAASPAATPAATGHGAMADMDHGTMPGMEMGASAKPAPGGSAAPGGEVVTVDARGAVLADVTTAVVSRQALAPRIIANGRVTFDESRLSRVTAWVDGRILRLYVATTGAPVRRGQPVAEVYAPDLLATQQELLMARESARALAGSRIEGVAADARRLVTAARRRLALSGLSNAQIAAIERRGKPVDTLPILAPANGIVTRRLVQAGDWVARGTALFEVADLSRVWVEADVYESELAGLRPGLPATITATAYPGESFAGRIAFVAPGIASETRTNAVRVELANAGGRLKPDMAVTASIALDRGRAIVVPADAVVDTGKRRVVWVQRAPGQFQARDVVVGAQTDDGWEIRQGLREGERIAVSGGFMLDASSQLDRGGGAHAGHGTTRPSQAPAHAGHGG